MFDKMFKPRQDEEEKSVLPRKDKFGRREVLRRNRPCMDDMLSIFSQSALTNTLLHKNISLLGGLILIYVTKHPTVKKNIAINYMHDF